MAEGFLLRRGDDQEEEFTDLIYLITEKMSPENLSRAMSGIMFNALTHGYGLMEILGKKCQIYFRNCALYNPEFNLTECGLVKISLRLPEEILNMSYSGNYGLIKYAISNEYDNCYLPGRALFSGISFCKTPADARAIFGLTEKSKPIYDLGERFIKYAIHKKNFSSKKSGFNINCALMPYASTLEIPLLLFMISDLIHSDIKINFKLSYFLDNQEDCDIGYGVLRGNKNYRARELYDSKKSLPLLVHKKFLRRYDNNVYCFDFQEFDMGGNTISYGYDEGIKMIYFFPKERFILEKEFSILLAMACGILPESTAIIPSAHGYMWAKNNGLIQTDLEINNEDKKCGVLLEKRINIETSDKFGFFVRDYTGAPDSAAFNLENSLYQGYFYIHEYLVKAREEVQKGNIPPEKFSQIASAFISPFSRNFYNGFLLNLNPELLIESIIRNKNGDYLNYRPSWWNEYNKIFD